MANDAKSILALAGTDAGFASNNFMANLVIIGLLRQIAQSQNPMAATDSKTILANSGCDACYADRLGLIQIGLLRLIANGIGGGGGGSSGLISSGVGQPAADPGVANAVYTDTATGNNFWWYNGAWH